MSRIEVVAATLAALTLSGCVLEPVRTSGRVVVQDENTRVEVAFNEQDRRRIREYYEARQRQHTGNKPHKNGLPPGLAKREQLPPGLQKQVEKNGTLPPGLQTRSLPPELERELSPVPPGYVRVEVGADVVLMNGKTRVIVDVVKDLPL
ncbi:hypothetical protein [Sulfurivermis fontis]|uniref:hypothetical protein n=1 Tax=Sulfurivermis fontis TaxID=1972068 RepID=UPI000FDBE192|nr:hypothetical protein [Sulfurivermis fontis]